MGKTIRACEKCNWYGPYPFELAEFAAEIGGKLYCHLMPMPIPVEPTHWCSKCTHVEVTEPLIDLSHVVR